MNKKQFLLALVFVALFSFLGGIVGGAISGGGIIMAAKDLLDDSTRENPKKINYLESKQVNAEYVKTKTIYVVNVSGDIVSIFSSSSSGDPYFALYSKEKPLYKNDNYNPAFNLLINNSEPMMGFSDKDLDERISIGIDKLEPYLGFRYRDKVRLGLGTNWTVNKDTGDEAKIKGSIYTFDDKGKITSQMP